MLPSCAPLDPRVADTFTLRENAFGDEVTFFVLQGGHFFDFVVSRSQAEGAGLACAILVLKSATGCGAEPSEGGIWNECANRGRPALVPGRAGQNDRMG